MALQRFSCIVKKIIFRNKETNYSVFTAVKEDNKKGYPFTVSGTFQKVKEKTTLQIEGEWRKHKKYGMQFVVTAYTEHIPDSVDGIEKYLASGLVEGIGEKYARLIVDYFGEETMNIIEHEPERLKEVYGIGKKRAESIAAHCNEEKEVREIMMFLTKYDIPNGLAVKIYKQYGLDSIKVLQTNPYQLYEDIKGVGFIKADQVAQNMGLDPLDENRIRTGLLYVLKEAADKDGHTFLLIDTLVKNTQEILKIDDTDIIDNALSFLSGKKKIVIEGEAVYLMSYYYCETHVAERINRLNQLKSADITPSDKILNECEKKCHITFTDTQRLAIKTAVKSNFSIMTGGPGTGKTTTTKGIINVLRMMRRSILLAAPTGRAAKRMSEVTGTDAQTIHRLLGKDHDGICLYNSENPLKGDVLIVDESSMIDIRLMCDLMTAVPKHMKVILIGDADQLPSVGAGNVLNDIIKSKKVPVIRLTKIFRQAEQSPIIRNAHKINKGQMPELEGKDGFIFIEANTPEEIKEKIVTCTTETLPKKHHIKTDEIQILCPQSTMPCGTITINNAIQDKLNPQEKRIGRAHDEIRPGDRIIQTKNNYDKDVMNGELGTVKTVDTKNRQLTANFDNKNVNYETEDISELLLAYAITVHRSQGSEFKAVIIPVSKSQTYMLQRSLLYTGVTRAKEICILIGDKEAIENAVHNTLIRKRNSNLHNLLH